MKKTLMIITAFLLTLATLASAQTGPRIQLFVDAGLDVAPVALPSSIRVLASTVNRTTRSGYVLGPQHCVEPIVALKAMTLWAAYQYFEEHSKGSIEVGKLADFVVLSDNPLTIERAKLADLKVLETIKEGTTVFRAR